MLGRCDRDRVCMIAIGRYDIDRGCDSGRGV